MLKIPENTIKEIYNFGNVAREYHEGKIELPAFKAYLAVTGIYEERTLSTYMIRARIPSGVITPAQLKEISVIAGEYSHGRIHFTTRQDIQFHGVKFEDLEKIMDRLLKIGLVSKGTGGSAPRNAVVDPLSGTASDSVFDVTSFGLAAAEEFLKNDENYKLPRKYKIAFSASEADRGLAKISDLGFVAVTGNKGDGFRVYAGGGLGGGARPAIVVSEFVGFDEVSIYVEAMRQFFFEQGDRTNRAKARVRHILMRLGEEKFAEELNRYVSKVKEENLIKGDNYKSYVFENIKNEGTAYPHDNINVFQGRIKGRYNVYIHPVNGHLSSEHIDKVLGYIGGLDYESTIRLTSTQAFYIRELDGKDVEGLLAVAAEFSEKTVINKVAACTGASTCKLGICLSQGLSKAIIDFYADKDEEIKNALPVINISGCPNSCGQHQIGKIGFTGRAKKIGENMAPVYQLTLGGDLRKELAVFGKPVGEIPARAIPEFLVSFAKLKIANNYKKGDEEFYRFISEKESEIEELVNKYSVIPSIEEDESFYRDYGENKIFDKKN